MRLVHALAAMLAFGAAMSLSASAQQVSPPTAFDASTPLESRIGGEVPPAIVKAHAEGNRGNLTTYVPTAEERRRVIAALAVLTPLQRQQAQDGLRTITFANGMEGDSVIWRGLEQGAPGDKFDIVINPIVLRETASEFLTRRERKLFDATGSTLSVSVDGGSMDAVVYVLLHETTHMVDIDFTRGVWSSLIKLAAPYHDPVFQRVNFAADAGKIPIAEAKSLYEALAKTPAVSIYAIHGFIEDSAETVAWRQMDKLKQPYRIEIRDGDRVVYAYEPLKNPLVQSRFSQLTRFDSPAAN
jgi:hypothetical protein